jgi:hypothetical protein
VHDIARSPDAQHLVAGDPGRLDHRVQQCHGAKENTPPPA